MPPTTYQPESPIRTIIVRSRIVTFLPICSSASYHGTCTSVSEDICRWDYIILFHVRQLNGTCGLKSHTPERFTRHTFSMKSKCIRQQILNCEITRISIDVNNGMWSKISQPLTASSARRTVLNGCILSRIDTCHSDMGNRPRYLARCNRSS